MRDKVGVLVLITDKEYITRCVKSVQSQTYKNVECWLIGETTNNRIENVKLANTLNEAVEKCDCASLFIAKSTYVLSPMCIEKLLEDEGSSRAIVLYEENECLVENSADGIQCFATLLPKEVLHRVEIDFVGDAFEDYFELYLGVLSECRKIGKNTDAYVYSNSEGKDYKISGNSLKRLYEKYNYTMEEYINENVWSFCDMEFESDLERLRCIVTCYSCIKEDMCTNLEMANKYVAPVIKKLVDENKCTNEEYIELQHYISKVLVGKDKDIIREVLGCSEKVFMLLETLDYEEFIQCAHYLDFKMEDSLEMTQLTKITKEIRAMRNELKKQSVANKVQPVSNTVIKREIDEVYGLELIDFTVNCYADGKLGFKTILKCIKAWIKHKL